MRLILKLLNYFFVTLGIIFFCLLIGLTYLFVADPFGIKPMLSAVSSVTQFESNQDEASPEYQEPVDANPMLDAGQEAALESVGIDPASVPSEITPEMEQCFEAALGVERVNEIKAGAEPNMTDLFKARGCIN